MFLNADGAPVIDQMIAAIQKNRDYLSEIDGKTGDGDHGINMNKGFALCQARLSGCRYTLSEGFAVLSSILMDEIGGSMGPLYGVFFEELALASGGAQQIDAALVGQMLHRALAAVQDMGAAKRGDKTLLDALIPAIEAYDEALAAGAPFDACLSAMKAGAEAGFKATQGMVAKVGRASRLGERSRGALDAGAASCYIILTAIADGMTGLNRR